MAVRLLGWTPRHFDASKLGCGSDCTVTGQIMFKHPAWGFVNLLTTVRVGNLAYPDEFPDKSMIVVVDRNDQIRYRSRTFTGLAWVEFVPVQSFPDTARSTNDGNLFIQYNQGLGGIIVLRPTSSGFDDFGSFGGLTTGEFFLSVVINAKRTGVIVHYQHQDQFGVNHVYPQLAQWNGSGYQKVPRMNFRTTNTSFCVSSFPRPPGVWEFTEVYSSTIACAEVVNLVRAIRNVGRPGSTSTWYEDSSFVNGFVCIRLHIGEESNDYQCVSGSRAVGFIRGLVQPPG